MISGAIFDMDGLLFDTESIYQKIWRDIALDHGIKLDDQFTNLISGTSGDEAKRMISEHYPGYEPSDIFAECAKRMLESTREHVDVLPGVREMLAFLRSKGVRCVVASGSSSDQIANNLRVSGLADMFDAIVGGTELIYGKPAPNIFLYAAEKIKCDSHDCLIFEDSVKGILAAHAAEAYPVWIPNMIAPNDDIGAMTYGVFVSMHDALEAIRQDKSLFPD